METFKIFIVYVIVVCITPPTVLSLRIRSNKPCKSMKVCENNDCQSGTCKVDSCNKRGYSCSCFPGYSGDNCEVGVCNSHDCQNGATCQADQSSDRGYSCTCTTGFVGINCEVLPVDCKDLFDNGKDQSGVYTIYPYGTISSPFSALCDMEIQGGGWTAIQKRESGSVSFQKGWMDYKTGFGSPEQDVWIGNDIIHQLVKGNDSSLYVSITKADGTTLYELYNRFSITDEAAEYTLFLDGPATGTLGDKMWNTGFSSYDLSGMKFSTPDRDNDRSNIRCAIYGGWWFNACYVAYLNGLWGSTQWIFPWGTTVTQGTDVKKTIMMIKRE